MPGLIAFTREGRSMAPTPSQRQVRLIETATGRVLANLTAPDRRQIRGLCFSPDHSQLAVATDDPAIQVWDLRQIRQRLAAMGLDGNLPPDPPASIGENRPAPVPPSGFFGPEPASKEGRWGPRIEDPPPPHPTSTAAARPG
jgi:hypothetical protein